jgi:hypothetical protein
MIGTPLRHTSRLVLGAGLAASLMFAACGLVPPPSASRPAPATSASIAPSTEASNSGATNETGQTDTDWGRIWDGLPEWFPRYPGGTPADDAATEVVSATFALADADPRTVAAWMQTELERATYATEALNGPLEDGSFVLESAGTGDCRIQVAIAPLGGLTAVSVRYGAACPSP